jgi:S1-C subfamily serine protease
LNTALQRQSLALVILLGLLASLLTGCTTAMSGTAAAAPAATAVSTPVPTAIPASTTAPAPVVALPNEQEAANALEQQIIAVYQAVAPAVVNITARSYVYDRFRGAIPQEGTGSGFVYDTAGHIVTNYHVVENAEDLLVTLANGQAYPAEIVGTDPVNDLAVIRIDAGADLPAPVSLGDSDQLQVGQFVLAIGNPFGLEQTLTTGVVSALGRVIESPDDNGFISEVIQTDAAINPGNSGGPLLDLEGRVIGINSQIMSTSGSSAGIGFAVSVNMVRQVVPVLIAQGSYPHPYLGADTVDLTPSTIEILREAGMNVPVESGLLVVSTVPGGPADLGGLQGYTRVVRIGHYQVPVDGDIVVAVNGETVSSLQDLTVYLETKTAVGSTVELSVLRDGQDVAVTVTLGEQP